MITLKSNFEVIHADAFFTYISNTTAFSGSQIEEYFCGIISENLNANAEGWEYGLIYFKTLHQAVRNDLEEYSDDYPTMEINKAMDIAASFIEPETLIAIQGW